MTKCGAWPHTQPRRPAGNLDILVNNAATLLMPTPTADVAEQVLTEAFAVNVFAPLLLTGLIAPEMARRGRGAIVNIGSIKGLRGASGSAVYSANKAAIHSFTKSWADEYGPSGYWKRWGLILSWRTWWGAS
jgi:NAD(P)-dependent dehydrogenase (short-subunit alcohol dehydrogenase family)